MDFSQFDFVNFTSYIDLAQVLLYVFWIFFAFLLFYIQQETRREGYPLESDESGAVYNHGAVFMPDPKTFKLPHGHGEVSYPDYKRETRELKLAPTEPWSGASKVPTGENPLLDGVGPGAWAERADVPDQLWSGAAKIKPMRVADAFAIPSGDPNPIGNPVVGCDGAVGGTVVDAWVDQAESVIRYYEIEVAGAGRNVLLPANFAVVRSNRLGTKLYVHAVTGAQFADVPLTKSEDEITMLEEEKIMGYYGAGYFYATPNRAESIF
ncbi:MAG: photosynthetic reaction center subunit H [Devosiaceae bacterium]|nr:photosynthetic reaction center subunit H [Devosiaceae bacterium MH13]